jgi:UDP-N-acetylglucosamine 2-epimerase (hydrolysing)
MKKIVFLTGTRADFGKMKMFIKAMQNQPNFECHIFVTGMHMLSKYGQTSFEIETLGFKNIYKYINQTASTGMDITLSNTILGFSHYVRELKPDMIIVHGDRVEALAGAIVGCFNSVLIVHIEGGEISGTVDELIRHSITKLAHAHFVCNEAARTRLIQMGESQESIFVTGSPDIDVMLRDDLPSIGEVKDHYGIDFDDYFIFVYHPVLNEVDSLKRKIKHVIDALIESKNNYVVSYPNNDIGNEIIIHEFSRFNHNGHFKVFPSLRFEFFLTLLKNCRGIIGNSSAGIREAGVYRIPAINIGSRQQNRSRNRSIVHVRENKRDILLALKKIQHVTVSRNFEFGDGKSTERFVQILQEGKIWDICPQKQFIDLLNGQYLLEGEDVEKVRHAGVLNSTCLKGLAA